MKKSAKDTKSLRESLAESLKQAIPTSKEEDALPVPASTSAREQITQPSVEASDRLPDPGKLVRATIALKPSEVQKAEQILDLLMSSRKRRGSMSEAISIALRLCPLDGDQIGSASDENRAADRRKIRGQRQA